MVVVEWGWFYGGKRFCFARIGLETPEMHSMDQCGHFDSEMAKLGEKWCDNSPPALALVGNPIGFPMKLI